MYTPKNFLIQDQNEILSFMKQFSFATVITSNDGVPLATHLPIVVLEGEEVVLSGHFAKANPQWKNIEDKKVLVIFSEPHAYISPKSYDKVESVPTWNYISVHAYGDCKLIQEPDQAFAALEDMILTYEAEYKMQWDKLPEEYKKKMLNGIVPFEIKVTDLQASKKLSQNKTEMEQERIIANLSTSSNSNELKIAECMREELVSNKK